MELDWKRNRLEGRTTIETIDAHAAGEPLRIITGGLPELNGNTILERRRYMQEHFDYIRKIIMWEPRGHYNMYGCILTPPITPEAHFGVLFLHNEGYSTMCGHGVIALVTTLLETGAVEACYPATRVNLDTPAGLVKATAYLMEDGMVERVSFENVASFVYAPDLVVDTDNFGKVKVNVIFGGAFYALLPAEEVGLSVDIRNTDRLVEAGEDIKRAVNRTLSIKHPFEEDLGFLYGTILTGPPEDPAHFSRNICVFANAEVDRSPTGTGVSARAAFHFASGEIKVNQPFVIESLLGRSSAFTGKVLNTTTVGTFQAVVPEVSGKGFITGRHQFIIDPRDELGKGFLV